jgi:dUTP pyrophosphatase
LLFNFSDQEFEVKYGDRVAQLIIEKISMLEIQEVEDLDATERGEGGFGSTGVCLKENNGTPSKRNTGVKGD